MCNSSFPILVFLEETRDAFIEEAITFVEVDLAMMQVRYFEEGVLTLSLPILAKGERGSWWETPSGLYELEAKKKKTYSEFGQMYMPWSLTFQGNFFIHGWPEYADGNPVPPDFVGGGVRLSTADAERLYALVAVAVPILVHEEAETETSFFYTNLRFRSY